MNHKTNVLSAFLGATMVFAGGSAQAAAVTNDWFDAAISGYTAGAIPATVTDVGAWTQPATDNSTVVTKDSASCIQLDTAGSLLRFTPADASASGENAFVDISLQFTAAEENPDMADVQNPQASIAVREDSGSLCYIAYSNGSWVRLNGATPDTEDFVDVRVEMDYTASTPLVSYLVKDNGAYVRLATTGGDEWLPLASSVTVDSVSAVAFSGSGYVGSLLGKTYKELAAFYVVSVDGADTPITLDATWIAEKVGAGATAAEVNAYLAGTGANGLAEWKSYVLGINDDDPIWVGAEQTDSATAMRIQMNGPTPRADAGITVSYRLQKKDGDTWTAVGDDQASPVFDIALASGDATGLYRILAVFTATAAN